MYIYSFKIITNHIKVITYNLKLTNYNIKLSIYDFTILQSKNKQAI